MYFEFICLLKIYVDRKFNPRKATRGMWTLKNAKAAVTGKLSDIFYADCHQPICSNTERFNNEIGFIILNHDTFCYKDWRMVDEEVRAPLQNYLLVIFLHCYSFMFMYILSHVPINLKIIHGNSPSCFSHVHPFRFFFF